jgi:CRP/FNR family transcriptional regulator, cyclic AMP receptor protein
VGSPGFFDMLDAEDQRLVRQKCVRRRFARNDFVFHAGEAGDCLHVVERGKVGVQVGGGLGEPLMLTILCAGDAFGEGALLATDHRRTASIVALESTETLMLRAGDYEELCRRHPSVNRLLGSVLAAQVRRLTERVIELAEVPGGVRVYRRLVELGELYGVSGTEEPIPLTQNHLASLAMVKLRLVSRVVGEARDQGVLDPRRGRIVVRDWSRLAAMAGVRRRPVVDARR